MKFKFLLLLFILVNSVLSGLLMAQDFSTYDLDTVSDTQFNQWVSKARNSGLSDGQIVEAARSKGVPQAQLEKLRVRLSKTNNTNNNISKTPADTTSVGRQLNYKPDTLNTDPKLSKLPVVPVLPVLPVFGSDLFSNNNLTFEPNLSLATPTNYILGPKDQLNINVYGQSVVNWKLDVSPEGNINIPGVGILNVSGKTISQATSSIKSKLQASRFAIGNGSSLSVTLGNIRSIKVIMVGQLRKPGTYTLPSLATAFNALYAAGGPNDLGSYRDIEIIRDNRVVRRLDIYDFLTKGDQQNNISLRDQDIIRVPSYKIRVELGGEVKTPALFEAAPGETLADVLQFAGGFTNDAYTARIKVIQVSDQQRRITDVTDSDFKNYIPLRGDKFFVDKIIDRFENRVTITGAVFRPGEYELERGMTLSRLIAKASGLKEDAFAEHGIITRLKSDNSKEIVSFNLSRIMSKQDADIPLKREDSVMVASVLDLRDAYKVTIVGEVRNPGEIAFGENMTVEDVILKAGGFREGASNMRIEVARRIHNSDPLSTSTNVAEVFRVNANDNLKTASGDFKLQPFDVVSVFSLPGFEKQRMVKVEGEVLYPGTYAIKTKSEKISDVVKRAGGLTATAYAEGSSLERTFNEVIDDNKNLTDSLTKTRASQLGRLRAIAKDSSTITENIQVNNKVGINLAEILQKPGSRTDITVENGDVLLIPKQQLTVRVNGEVLYPSTVVYDKDKSLKDYISNAGGFGINAYKSKSYVVYANGSVKGTHKFLFFNAYPEVKPGSDILVPKKPIKRGLSTTEVVGITTALASLAAVILGIISLHK